MKRLTFLGFVCLAGSLAIGPFAAASGPPAPDSIHITGVTPASGNFPTSGPGVVIDFDWVLSSTADGQIAAFFTSAPGPGPGQTGLPPTFMPLWLSKGKGHAQVSLWGACSETTVPAGTVTEVRVVLSKSGHMAGPIGPELANGTKAVQYTYACPKALPPVDQRRRPDITSKKGITLGGDVGGAGGKFSAWGGHINLTEADTKLPVGNGKCAFNASYDMENIGTAATSPDFLNHLKEDANVVAINSVLHLNAGEPKQVNTQVYLTPGTHVLSLWLDDGGAAPNHVVHESNESNNVFRVKVTLDAKCGAKPVPTLQTPR